MRHPDNGSWRGGFGRSAATGLVFLGLLVGVTGSGCDSDAQADFRQEATESIGQGVKTIVDAMIDGFVAAIVNAGDGPTDSSS